MRDWRSNSLGHANSQKGGGIAPTLRSIIYSYLVEIDCLRERLREYRLEGVRSNVLFESHVAQILVRIPLAETFGQSRLVGERAELQHIPQGDRGGTA